MLEELDFARWWLKDPDWTTPRSKRGSENSWGVDGNTPRLFDHNNRVAETNDGASRE